jgi:hypothetical protein
MGIAIPLIFLATGSIAQTPASRTAIQNQIITGEKAIMDAIGKNDPKGFHAYVADGLVVTPYGVARTADFDQMIGQCKYTRWGLSGSQFTWINDTTVVHVYKWAGKGMCGGQPVPESRWSSTVWTKAGGKWVAAFHHEATAVEAPAPPAKK